MSRVGKKPIPIPQGVTFAFKDGVATASKGNRTLTVPVDNRISVSVNEHNLVVVDRANDSADCRALHGLIRSLVSNMVVGLVQPWEVKLEIVGVGYLAAIQKNTLQLRVGFANELQVTIPPELNVTCPDQTHITIKGIDKQLVGQFAAEVRSLRKPEPYKGKGIRYENEQVRRKAGKAVTK